MRRARRVAVTGLGVVSPVGIGVDAFWDQLTHGASGVRRISKFDAAGFPSQIAGEVTGFDAETYLPRRDIVRTDTFIHFALAGAQQALADAKLEPSPGNARMGVSIGTGLGGLPLLLTTHDSLQREQMRGVTPYAMLGFLPNMAPSWVSMRAGARGPIACATTGCAAGAQAIGDAGRFIERGDADIMIAGGSDSLISPLMIACFCALRALSTRNDAPAAASRPFDNERDGFVLGEGAGIVVLEELEHARRRGCHIYAEVAGYAVTADAYHPTLASADGPAQAMGLALADAGVAPEQVEYINAHGTSTRHNDANETLAIKQVFGAHAYRLAVSSTKSMTGHLMGATGAVEAVATVLALEHGVLPPTINYASPDADCARVLVGRDDELAAGRLRAGAWSPRLGFPERLGELVDEVEELVGGLRVDILPGFDAFFRIVSTRTARSSGLLSDLKKSPRMTRADRGALRGARLRRDPRTRPATRAGSGALPSSSAARPSSYRSASRDRRRRTPMKKPVVRVNLDAVPIGRDPAEAHQRRARRRPLAAPALGRPRISFPPRRGRGRGGPEPPKSTARTGGVAALRPRGAG